MVGVVGEYASASRIVTGDGGKYCRDGMHIGTYGNVPYIAGEGGDSSIPLRCAPFHSE
jgi:hypothetical protein